MSEEMSEPVVNPDGVIGEINIHITNDSIKYESQFSLPEVVFWIDALKLMIMQQVTTPVVIPDPAPEGQ